MNEKLTMRGLKINPSLDIEIFLFKGLEGRDKNKNKK